MADEGQDVLRVYIINQFTHWFIVGLIFPVLILVILDKGLDLMQAGGVMAAYSAAVILLELPTGGLSDSLGRKRVYLVSVCINLAAGTVLLLADGFLTVLVAVILMGTGRAFSSGSMDAWFVDEFKKASPQGNLQKALARAGIFIPIGIGIGSLVGGLIPSASSLWSGALPGLGTYSMNIIAMLLMAIVQLALTSALVRETVVGGPKGVRSGLSTFPRTVAVSLKHGVRDRLVLSLLLAMLTFGMGLSAVELLWQPRVVDIMGASSSAWILGVLAAGYFFSASVGSLVSPRVCATFKDNYAKALIALRIFSGGALFLLAMQGSILGFALFYFLFFLVVGSAESPHATLYNQRVPDEVRSTMLSFQSLLAQAGGLLGTLGMGIIASTFSIGAAWMVTAAALALSSGFYAYYLLAKGRESERAQETAKVGGVAQ